jgi:RNA polymerase sigma-70 factor (ECF subfamily)
MTRPAADSPEIQTLLERVGKGDRQAFEPLFESHRAYLRQVIDLRMVDLLRVRVDPSDIVQETQLEAFRRLEDYVKRKPMPFRLWLRRTAVEQLVTAQRRHLGAERRAVGKEIPLPDRSSLLLAEQFLASDSSPSQRLCKSELARRVREALGELSEDDREILVLRNLEALSNQEAAEVLQIQTSTASQRYGRALTRLGKVLAAAGIARCDA